MKTLSIILTSVALTSCSIYHENFDCPAGRGVGCKSVGEVLDMIVEKEGAEDLFIRDLGMATILREEVDRESQYSRSSKRDREPLILIQKETGLWSLEKEEYKEGERDG